MERREGKLTSIRDLVAEKTIELETLDPIARFGFTQVPNFILTDANLGVGAKLTYAMFLHYAWHKDSCFPGQERLAEDMGISRSRVTQLITELQKVNLISVQRRGQGKTNLYTVHFSVKAKGSVRAVDKLPDVN